MASDIFPEPFHVISLHNSSVIVPDKGASRYDVRIGEGRVMEKQT